MTSHIKISEFNQRGDQCNSFNISINSLRQLVTALGQIFSFLLYTGHMMSSKHSGDRCDVIFGKKLFFFGII